jgi:hypothetical protein
VVSELITNAVQEVAELAADIRDMLDSSEASTGAHTWPKAGMARVADLTAPEARPRPGGATPPGLGVG